MNAQPYYVSGPYRNSTKHRIFEPANGQRVLWKRGEKTEVATVVERAHPVLQIYILQAACGLVGVFSDQLHPAEMTQPELF